MSVTVKVPADAYAWLGEAPSRRLVAEAPRVGQHVAVGVARSGPAERRPGSRPRPSTGRPPTATGARFAGGLTTTDRVAVGACPWPSFAVSVTVNVPGRGVAVRALAPGRGGAVAERPGEGERVGIRDRSRCCASNDSDWLTAPSSAPRSAASAPGWPRAATVMVKLCVSAAAPAVAHAHGDGLRTDVLRRRRPRDRARRAPIVIPDGAVVSVNVSGSPSASVAVTV